ncbi:trifunctional serine/threonine-protein kinase/ATP-binding protein/sensor histidine kinase [Kamptonema formosum]|uniref:trifunctional serine/threonine-protein kinase/ATP-binding protein/sensor histidine kinase n=1 Tax=Kamptonema formosum TaxID=331992 RepID=UPI0003465A4B|nr:ATP-binding sensor histidine kinase [Oscillatoria sp. PCC 10802]
MKLLAGYRIAEQIHSSVKTLIYRGLRESDQTPVIIKVLNTEYPTLSEIVRLRNQYTIARNLEWPGIVKTFSLEPYQNGFALIQEDFGGKSLKDYIASTPLTLLRFMKIAIQIAGTLEGLALNRIIHKDIKPENILINPETLEVKLTDFSISSLLPRETQSLKNPSGLEGTLAYMSPEQTGRMNRGIDYRTDFYSLGVTFYEMLTGQLPFPPADPMELVHCHIAKQPVPPHELQPAIPHAVSAIVMKLMAKTAEDRYQSARGLKADLETCLHRWETAGTISHFSLGKRDISDRFQIPEKLYGREAEIASLMAAFDRAAGGATEMMLVAGFSGTGKSATVREVHKPIVAKRGYFITGKFDHFKRNIPFTALVQAFRDLIRQLLTESQDRIALWKDTLTKTLGANAQVIIDVIPEVERIVGKQAGVAELGPTESQNRFNRVFQKFIRVFAQADHPLVLFLDDLQWADSASLKLLQLLVADPDTQYLFVIGAYRDSEVSRAHPLMLTADTIKKAGATVSQIVLQPLTSANLTRLVADALSCPEERAQPLAQQVFQKTEGNPFFATQFLKSLYEEGVLKYDSSLGYWQCDIAKVKALAVSENVVEFMAAQLQKLPVSAQEVLKLAACTGNQFDLETVAIVREKSPAETAADLWKALQEGLVLPVSEVYKFFQDEGKSAVAHPASPTGKEEQSPVPDEERPTYKFLHDRVQQAAYSLIPEADKKATHLKIGQLLLENTRPEELEESIFDIVNQLNIGVELIASESETQGGLARKLCGKRVESINPYQLAQLNLIAGRKAQSATAYEPAVRYLNVGLELLGAECWTHSYETALALYVAAAEAHYLNTNFERSKHLSDIALQHAKTLLEKVKIYEIVIQYYIAQNQMQAAIDTALQILEALGVSLERDPLTPQSIEDLADLPVMAAPYKLAAMRILLTVTAPSFIANPLIGVRVIFTALNLSIKYGNCSLAASAYAYYGVLLCGPLGDIESGYQFGKLGLRLLEKFSATSLKCQVCLLFYTAILQWKEHARETVEPLAEAIQSGQETGSIEYACYSAVYYCTHSFFIGENLEAVERKFAHSIELAQNLKQAASLSYLQIWQQTVLNLLGESEEVTRLQGRAFDEGKMLPALIESKNFGSIFSAYFAKAFLLYLHKDFAQSLENAKLAETYAEGVGGALALAKQHFYWALALLALYPAAEEKEREQSLLKVGALQEKLKQWAAHAPANFQHNCDLVAAEKARVLGDPLLAMELYDRAISGAKNTGYIQEESLGNELAAEFYLALGRERIAQTYLTDAYYGYARWGAIAKARDLETRYPRLLARITARTVAGTLSAAETLPAVATQTNTATTTGGSAVLDLAAAIKASLALSEEIVLEKLLSKLMRVILENAGAQKGCLVLEKAGKLAIEAAGAIDCEGVAVLQSIPIESSREIPAAIVNYTNRTQEYLVLNDAAKESIFAADPYIAAVQPKSVLCSPVLHKGKRIGILYLENNLSVGVFTPERLEVLKLLSSQAAISLENALLYRDLQQSEAQLQEKATQLEQSLEELQRAQLQVIQSEKMSSLGQLVAGVAHEINNPVGFIHGNLSHAVNYTNDILNHLQLYRDAYPHPVAEIKKDAEAIDLEYLIEDLPKMLSSMKFGTDRISEIVRSLRTFSRSDADNKTLFDIHQGTDSTLLILAHRLKPRGSHPGIKVIKEYGNLPLVECYAGPLNQVFMNLLANAIDALEEQGIQEPAIRIRTEVVSGHSVAVRIADNGAGMTEEVRSKLFKTSFTTKSAGKGTGLGLPISYQIVVEKHGGQLHCVSQPGQGAEFIIEIPLGQPNQK